MVKRTGCIALLLLASSWVLPALDQPASALLDGLVAQFKQMSSSGGGGYAKVDKILQDLMAEAKKAHIAKQVDASFYRRYTRILEIMKLAIIVSDYDREGILSPLVQREINSFVTDVTGIEADCKDRGIAQLADAIGEEIIGLYMTIDCRSQHEEWRKKLNGGSAEPK